MSPRCGTAACRGFRSLWSDRAECTTLWDAYPLARGRHLPPGRCVAAHPSPVRLAVAKAERCLKLVGEDTLRGCPSGPENECFGLNQTTPGEKQKHLHRAWRPAARLQPGASAQANGTPARGSQRRDRRCQLHDRGDRAAGGSAPQDRQGLLARHHGEHDDAGLPAARLLHLHRAAAADRLGRRSRADPHDLQRRHPELLERHRQQLDGLGHIASAIATTTASSGASSRRWAA